MRDFVVVGLSHRTAPVEVREHLAVTPDRLEQELRNTAKTESSGRDQHPVMQKAIQRLGRIGVDLLHAICLPDPCWQRF